jgi:hypothetical protein
MIARGYEEHPLGERFDPFHDPYLADPHPFFAEARAVTPVFYSADLGYWVVTRYRDVERILQTPTLFSAANTLAPLQPICPAAGLPRQARRRTTLRGEHLLTLHGDQNEPAYLQLNPSGVVPTLVHDGQPIVESSLILYYLDDIFPEPPLMPEAPLSRFRVRATIG